MKEMLTRMTFEGYQAAIKEVLLSAIKEFAVKNSI